MLPLKIPSFEYYDEKKGEFGRTKDTTLLLEHSLIAVAKWESKWNLPFLGRRDKTVDQCIDYVRCMTTNPGVNPVVYYGLTTGMFDTIDEYINRPMTAAWFTDKKDTKQGSRETVTADLIYYWMIALHIPLECEKWHLNRLLTLIRICNIKNAPAKKMSRQEILERNRALNAARKAKMHSKG